MISKTGIQCRAVLPQTGRSLVHHVFGTEQATAKAQTSVPARTTNYLNKISQGLVLTIYVH